MIQIIFFSFLVLNFLTLEVNGQQNYSGTESQKCDNIDESGPSPAILYTCNGQNRFCQSFLIFKSQPSFNSVRTISNLTLASPDELARLNKVKKSEYFALNKEVIVPVNCSCAGEHYYQANATLILRENDTYFTIANGVFQGLSPCSSLRRANSQDEHNLQGGMELKVPLRCACPTRNQIQNGTKYLLTYPISKGDDIAKIGERFNVSAKSILDANGFSEENPITYSNTAILIPLSTEPLISQTKLVHKGCDYKKPFSSSETKSKKKFEAIFGITAGCSLLVLFVVVLAAVSVYRKRSSKGLLLPTNRRTTSKRMSPEDLRVEIASFERVLQRFGIEEIKKATDNFSSENRIVGSIYHGVFGKSHVTLAVKKTKRDVSREVNILKKLNHFNLIKLEGVCKYKERSYLIFEYMENGSLREWLSKNDKEKDWSWNRRIQIALDIAHGLNYLHSFTEPAYVHKNIKSSNILLNRDTRAKIANFGLAGPATGQVKTTSGSSHTTTHVVGTRGYVAPEYLENGISTPKIDIYAFGVVVLELLSGKNALIGRENGRQVLLSKTIVEIMEGDEAEAKLDLFIDHGLKEYHRYAEFAIRVAKLSVACLKLQPETRPSMGDVISTLTKIQADLHKK
ncbi:protein LYK5-like [Humulus lupulus]|uniref:protein LYK5-like n=1 Tax=Humulus lupulus TaxID=3486 RepID=UPI002B4171D5|nr:protein LYK5-like [Humulus lupulus]